MLFVDEIHRVNRAIEEILYPALEDFRLDIVVGQGPAARTLTLDLPPFTLVGATTRTGLLTTPAPRPVRHDVPARLLRPGPARGRSCCRSARILDTEIEDGAAEEIARRSRGTPRIANRILRRVRDVAQVRHAGVDHRSVADEALELLEVDDEGLERTDRELLGSGRRQVRRRARRALDARGGARRGAGHDRGRLRAVPPPARVPAADAPRPRDHGARPRPRRRAPRKATAAACSRSRAQGAGPPRSISRWMQDAVRTAALALVAEELGARDAFVFRRIAGGRFAHLGGTGRGEGWAGHRRARRQRVDDRPPGARDRSPGASSRPPSRGTSSGPTTPAPRSRSRCRRTRWSSSATRLHALPQRSDEALRAGGAARGRAARAGFAHQAARGRAGGAAGASRARRRARRRPLRDAPARRREGGRGDVVRARRRVPPGARADRSRQPGLAGRRRRRRRPRGDARPLGARVGVSRLRPGRGREPAAAAVHLGGGHPFLLPARARPDRAGPAAAHAHRRGAARVHAALPRARRAVRRGGGCDRRDGACSGCSSSSRSSG